MTKENKTHDTLDVENAAIGVESCQEKKDNKDNSSKDNDKKDEKTKQNNDNNKKDKGKFAKKVNELFKRGSCLFLFLITAAISTVFPIFLIPALGFLFRSTLSDKVINNSLNNKNGIVKAVARCLYMSTGIGAIKHINKLAVNGKVEVNSEKGIIKDIIDTKLDGVNGNKSKTKDKKRKTDNLDKNETLDLGQFENGTASIGANSAVKRLRANQQKTNNTDRPVVF